MSEDNGRAIVVANRERGLTVNVDQALAEWEQYQELTRKLLDPTDYQATGSGPNAKKFKKKSAWRKYAKAFALDDHVSFEHIERAPDGYPLWARVRVIASTPDGRSAEGDHECHILERCCDAKFGRVCGKRSWRNHTCCKADCDGRQHWSHPGDIPATALTRAKNRAIADLIGAGEVSAEEMDVSRSDVIDGEAREVPSETPSAPQPDRVTSPTDSWWLKWIGMVEEARVLGVSYTELTLPVPTADLVKAGTELNAALETARELQQTLALDPDDVPLGKEPVAP